MTTVIEGIEVAFEPLDEDYRKTAVTVRVHSRKRPGLRGTKQIDVTTLGSAQAVAQLVGVAAAAAAEYLDQKYGDVISPERAAKLAIQALGEESRLHAECGKGFSIKLARARAWAGKLQPQERELLERIEWRAGKGLTTPSEVVQVDRWIAEIHSGQLG